MKKIILIIGSIFTLLLTVLWYFNIVSEPLVAIGTAILTAIGYILIPDEKQGDKTTINQKHTGQGDNVVGKKVVNNNRIEVTNSKNTTVQLANNLINNNYTIAAQEKEREKGNTNISKFSAIEIRKAIDESPVFQREEVAKNYRGIRIKWKVTLYSIHPKSENIVRLMTNSEGKYPWVNFELDLKEYPNLKVAKEGCGFIVTGLILNYRNNGFDIELENLEEV